MDILILSHTIFFIILNKSMIIDKWLSLYSYCNLFIITIPSYFRCGLTGDNRTKMCFLSFVYINIGDWFKKSIQWNEWLDKRIDFFSNYFGGKSSVLIFRWSPDRSRWRIETIHDVETSPYLFLKRNLYKPASSK